MSPVSPAILATGLVTSVGLSAPASCAAIRANVANPTQTRFVDSSGEPIMAHQLPLEQPWRGRTRLVEMAALALEECLVTIARKEWAHIPLLLCLAEPERPGRLEGLDEHLLTELQRKLQVEFSPQSRIIPQGRVSALVALEVARDLLSSSFPYAVILATDSLLTGPTLSQYERNGRLLTSRNSNGFLPGEGAGAVLVGPAPHHAHLVCAGVGFAIERANIDSEQPLRAEGLGQAIRNALGESGCALQDIDWRITDLAGEQYYFKEAALAVSRILRVRKEELDLWHPAECIGETGALAGLAGMVVAEAACRKSYANGPNLLLHAGTDGGQRSAAVLQFRT